MRFIVQGDREDVLSVGGVDIPTRDSFEKWLRAVRAAADAIWPPTEDDPNNETIQSEQG